VRTGIRSKVITVFGIEILITIIIIEIIFGIAVYSYYYNEVEDFLENKLSISAEIYNKYLSKDSVEDKAKLIVQNSGLKNFAEIQLIDIEGNIIESSNGEGNYTVFSDKGYGKVPINETGVYKGKNIHNEEILAVSVPLYDDHMRVVGILRAITSVVEVNDQIFYILRYATLIGIGIFSVIIVLSSLLANSIIEPIRELTRVSKNIADGELETRVNIKSNNEIGDLANTFNYMADEILKSEKLKTEFISSISHELRTPLTAIKGWSETILYGGFDDLEESRDGMEIIINETDRLSKLVEELLDFSRLQTNKMVLNKTPMNINDLLLDIKKLLLFKTEHRNENLQFEMREGLDVIEADYNRLKQVLINVIDNALKHSDAEGKVIISLKQLEDSYRITVEDSGKGMSTETLKNVKKKFFKGNINSSGSGLGLAIADEIVKLHGGVLDIESKINEGTKVKIELPLKTEEESVE